MLTKLDLWLFGNGNGLAQTYFDGRFFWLVDTMDGRERGRGRLYSFFGGHGAQLKSIEWRMPHPAERRRKARTPPPTPPSPSTLCGDGGSR